MPSRRLSSQEKKLSQLVWDKWRLPTKPQLRVLRHLLEPGEPRLYHQRREYPYGIGYSASVTNSESNTGFSTVIDVQSLIHSGMLELDAEATAKCARNIKAYRISKKGREAVAQCRIHEALEARRAIQLREYIALAEGILRDHGL